MLGERADARDVVLVARSVAEDGARWAGVAGRVVDDDKLGRAVREAGDALEVVAARSCDPSLLRALRDQPPPLLILLGPADPELVDELASLGRGRVRLLGPNAALLVGEPGDPSRAPPIACAAHVDELDRLCRALGPTRLALTPTPAWLPSWLGDPRLAAHDVVGYVPAEALSLSWIDWIEQLGPRELRQLLVPLGVPSVDLDRPLGPSLEPATVAHTLERLTGPTYPAPQVLALLREGVRRHLDARAPGSPGSVARPSHDPSIHDPAALALWGQARRALPRLGELVGMQRPDPDLPLRIPTAAFLAQRGLLRIRASERLLSTKLAPLAPLEPELLERADAVLEGAAEVLSDQESKVVLRGHGIEVTRQAFANSASGAASFADKIGYPVALKALSPELRRKREIGALELDVPNAAAVKRAYAEIVANVEERAPTVQLDGVVVAEMIGPGLDLRCGGLRMRSGGVALYAHPVLEAPIEPVLARSPLTPSDALLLAEAVLATAPMPARRRASDPDVGTLARLLLRLDSIFRHTGERLLCIDLAPVRLLDQEREYVTLDARIVQRPHLEGE
ncbi:MAG: acetate--CoA ligase family protein [Enhygromyxa sp.]